MPFSSTGTLVPSGTLSGMATGRTRFSFWTDPSVEIRSLVKVRLVNACVCFCLAKCNKNKHLLSFDRFRWMLIFRWKNFDHTGLSMRGKDTYNSLQPMGWTVVYLLLHERLVFYRINVGKCMYKSSHGSVMDYIKAKSCPKPFSQT